MTTDSAHASSVNLVAVREHLRHHVEDEGGFCVTLDDEVQMLIAEVSRLHADLAQSRQIIEAQQTVVEAADDVLVATSPHDDRRAWSNLREAMAHLNAANVPITQGLPD